MLLFGHGRIVASIDNWRRPPCPTAIALLPRKPCQLCCCYGERQNLGDISHVLVCTYYVSRVRRDPAVPVPVLVLVPSFMFALCEPFG